MIDVWYVYSVYGMSMYSIYIYTRIYVCVWSSWGIWNGQRILTKAKMCFKNPIFYLLQDDYMRVCICVCRFSIDLQKC